MNGNTEKWHSLEIEDIVDRLKTDIHSGLDADEVKRRSRASRGGLYHFPQLVPKEAAKAVMNDVALYFFCFVALICAVFGNFIEAFVIILLIALNCFATVTFKVAANRYENAVAASSIPRTDVLRQGRIYNIDGRSVVEGDILFFKAGDILPCDVRLIRSNGLSVLEAVAINPDGSLQYARSSKNAQTMEDARVPLRSITNIVFAGSVITSGYARGIAVECGQNTFIGKTKGGIAIRSLNQQSAADNTINSLFRFLTIGMFVLIFPMILLNLFSQSSAVAPIDAFLQTSSLAISLPLQTITVLYALTITCAVKMSGKALGGNFLGSAVIKNYSSLSALNGADKLFLIGPRTVTSQGLGIEGIYAGLSALDPVEETVAPSSVKDILEYAFLINKAAVGSVSDFPKMLTADHGGIYLNTLRTFGSDVEKLTQSAGYISYKHMRAEGASDVAIVSLGDDFGKRSRLICRSVDRRLIDRASWYQLDGMDVMLDDITRDKIRAAYGEWKALGYEVISFATASPKCYDADSFEDFDDQLIFLGMIAVGPVYARTNPESVAQLIERGLSPVICLPTENEESTYIVKNIFCRVDRVPNIVYASETEGDIPTSFVADAYIGFSREDLAKLMLALRNSGVGCASVVVDFSDIAIAKYADYVAAYSYEALNENACAESYPARISDRGASCAAVKNRAALMVPPVTPKGGGVDGVLRALKAARCFFANLDKAVSYLLFSVIARMLAVYLPLLFGRPAMNSGMILFLGCLIDLAVIILLSADGRSEERFAQKEKSFSTVNAVLKRNIKNIISALLSGAVIAAVGFILPKEQSAKMQAYSFLTVLLVQLIRAVLLFVADRDAFLGKKPFVSAIAFLGKLLAPVFVFALIPGVRSVLGFDGGVAVYLQALIVAVICGGMTFAFCRTDMNE